MKALIATAIGACCAVIFLCLIVAGSAAYFTWDLHQTQIVLRASIAPLQDAASKGIADTFDNLNRPCAPGPCGLLPNGTKVETKVGDAIVTTQLQERTTAPHVIAAMDTFNTAAQKLGSTADSLSGTATALTGTATAATATLSEGKRTIAAFQPVLAGLTEATGSINGFLKGQMLTKTLPEIAVNLDATTGSLAGTAADVRSEVFKWTHPSKKKLGFWGGTWAGIQAVHKLEPPIF
jgi:hypothetical protein